MDDLICPACGDDLDHWNQGIYECRSCDYMVDSSIFDDEE